MAGFSDVRDFLGNYGLDVKTLITAGFIVVTALWAASEKYSAFEAHLAQLDRGQVDLQNSIAHQDDIWHQALIDQNQALIEHLKQISEADAKARTEIITRVSSLEAWREDEQKRDANAEMATARISEQITSMHADVSDLKALFQGVIVENFEHMKGSR